MRWLVLKYKTRCVFDSVLDGVPYAEFKRGLTMETGERALAPFQAVISEEGAHGWTFHCVQCVPQLMRRKKSILELIFGWIPFVGKWLFPTMIQEVKIGVEQKLYMLVFVRDEDGTK